MASGGHSQEPITDLIGSNLVLDPRTEKVRSGGGGLYLSSGQEGQELQVTGVRVSCDKVTISFIAHTTHTGQL